MMVSLVKLEACLRVWWFDEALVGWGAGAMV